MKTNAQTALDAITATADSLTNPTYGLVAGLNCKVLGEDIIIAKNTVCVSLFNSIFFLLVTVGTTSFAFLFGMCCITCSGVRHYKQDQTKQKIGDFGDKTNSYDHTEVQLNQHSYSNNQNPYAYNNPDYPHPPGSNSQRASVQGYAPHQVAPAYP